MKLKLLLLAVLVTAVSILKAQAFYFGADLSYTNEMEDCGAVYKNQGQPSDPYQLFAAAGCNLVRLRLWHTPQWLDTLNSGKRYSDFTDVKRSMQRAKMAGMPVLLDFHLSDSWADPSKQVMPLAWLGVADQLNLLSDSLYNYIFKTLIALNADSLWPTMIQIGNETNRGILLTPAVNAQGWSLDWNRNAVLFNRAIKAVRDAETAAGKETDIMLHIAGPAEAGWLMQGFWTNGVTDFDVIGLSYYWKWHAPTTIAGVGDIISQLQQKYPGKGVIIVETGYPWTAAAADAAGNLFDSGAPGYGAPSPSSQKQWLTDLTLMVRNKGGQGVVYWEPAWVSTGCSTPWGKGSHYENAAFFDFNTNAQFDGGFGWLSTTSAVDDGPYGPKMKLVQENKMLKVTLDRWPPNDITTELRVFTPEGRLVLSRPLSSATDSGQQIAISELSTGLYVVAIYAGTRVWARGRVWWL